MIENIEDGKIKRIIRENFVIKNPKKLDRVLSELEAVIKPVISQLQSDIKTWEREAESARDDASYAWSEAEESKKEIARMESEEVRRKMLEQFYSY